MKKLATALLAAAPLVLPAWGHAQVTWQQTNGPFGGSFSSLLVSAPGDLFAAGEATPVYRSKDDGASWAQVGLPSGAATALVRDEARNLYAAGSTVYRSTDHGETWTRITTQRLGVAAMAVAANGSLFAGTYSGDVLRSADGGVSWIKVSGDVITARITAVAVAPSGLVYVATRGAGIFRSIDQGETWENVWGATGPADILSLIVTTEGRVFAGTWGGIVTSADDGLTWSTIWLGDCVWSLGVDTSGTLFAGTMSHGVFRSLDGGNTWAMCAQGLTTPDVWAFSFKPNGQVFVGTRGGGVFRSPDTGVTWQPASAGLRATRVYALALGPSGEIIAGTGSEGLFGNGIFRSADRGETWVPDEVSPYASIRSFSTDPGPYLFAGTLTGIWRSAQGERAWIERSQGLASRSVDGFAIDPGGQVRAAAWGSGIFGSADHGDHWLPAGTEAALFYATSVVRMPAGPLVAGSYGGAFLSQDNGQTWTPITANLDPPNVTRLTLGPRGELYAGTTSGLYRHAEGEESWSFLGLEDLPIYSMAFGSSGSLFVAAGGGVYQRKADNQDWLYLHEGLETHEVWALLIDAQGYLWAGTMDGGVFRTSKTTNSVRRVVLDIKPGSCVNPLNPRARGVLPAAIVGTNDLDVRQVDVSSLRLAGVAPLRSSVEDVARPPGGLAGGTCAAEGPDGIPDLSLKFDIQAVAAALGALVDGAQVPIAIQGRLLDGTPLEGTDTVVIRAKASP